MFLLKLTVPFSHIGDYLRTVLLVVSNRQHIMTAHCEITFEEQCQISAEQRQLI